MPDSGGILYDVTQDDGVSNTAAELWYASRRTGRRAPLTATPDVLEMHPDPSPDGRRVAFESRGTIWLGFLM